jgi:3-deoxy-D-manno-octulosonate 8-phosphate phosphatase (KDO 8-P phosphatase)
MIKDGRISREILNRAAQVQVILMDVDGVLTSGMIVYDSNGVEIKHFNAHDGLAFKLARAAGLRTGFISARESGTIHRRAKELGVDFLHLGSYKKLDAYQRLKESLKLQDEHFCFIGDDLPDIPVLRRVGFAVAVRNATDLVKEEVHYITQREGGNGAVREVVELILDAQGLLESAVEKILSE